MIRRPSMPEVFLAVTNARLPDADTENALRPLAALYRMFS
jgi:hypothetical protein